MHRSPDEELYDLKSDPYEVNNLADDMKYGEIRKDLSNQLDTWTQTTGDMGETPESDETKSYWDENMDESFRERMEQRGLTPDISDADYVEWWEQKLL